MKLALLFMILTIFRKTIEVNFNFNFVFRNVIQRCMDQLALLLFLMFRGAGTPCSHIGWWASSPMIVNLFYVTFLGDLQKKLGFILQKLKLGSCYVNMCVQVPSQMVKQAVEELQFFHQPSLFSPIIIIKNIYYIHRHINLENKKRLKSSTRYILFSTRFFRVFVFSQNQNLVISSIYNLNFLIMKSAFYDSKNP